MFYHLNPIVRQCIFIYFFVFLVLGRCIASSENAIPNDAKAPFRFDVVFNKEDKSIDLAFKNTSKMPLKLRIESFHYPLFSFEWNYINNSGQFILGGSGKGGSGSFLEKSIHTGKIITLLPSETIKQTYDISKWLQDFKTSKGEFLVHQAQAHLSLRIKFLDLIESPHEAGTPEQGFSFTYVPSIDLGNLSELWPGILKNIKP